MQFAIVNFSEIALHQDYRWDSEYLCFEPHKNENVQYVPIGEVLLSSQYGLSIEMNEDGIGTPIYRMNEISNMMCKRNILKHAKISVEEIENYRLNDKDVLFNRTNSQAFVGRTGLFRKFSEEKKVFASYLVRMVPNQELVTPEYLTAFLNTKYGIIDVKRRARVSINQSNVNAEELKRVEMPLFTHQLQSKVSKAFDAAFDMNKQSSQFHEEAQNLLLTELGLNDWQPKHQLTFIKNFSDTCEAGRIDAEYFQPKYDEIINAIKAYKGGWDRLENLVKIKKSNFMPKDARPYQYIEISNIGMNGEITDCVVDEGHNLPSRARRKVNSGDVIVSSIEGSLTSIALIENAYNNALCSTGFHVVSPEEFNSESFLVLLKNLVGQMQLKKGCSGTILTAINHESFRNIILPKIIEDKQIEIQQKVTEYFDLRKKSKQLLENAKCAVEMAIEKDEGQAIEWLDENTVKLL